MYTIVVRFQCNLCMLLLPARIAKCSKINAVVNYGLLCICYRLKHRLTFESEEKLVLAKDANVQNEDTFDIYDPRNPLNKRRRGEENAKAERQRHQQQNKRGKPRT